jgi:hypothetical protein
VVSDDVAGTDWSLAELRLIVADYFAMLREEQSGGRPNKTTHRKTLMSEVRRTDGSIEFKHQNISAVLMELGLPHIRGYKPARNYQGAIFDAIDEYLSKIPDPIPYVPRQVTEFADQQRLFEEPPPRSTSQRRRAPERLIRLVRKFDPALRDQLNRELGLSGERRIYEHERQKLIDADRPDLARKVRWVSQVDGDGAGYDIRSYDARGTERWIEVKTTRGGRTTPFYLTRNENEIAKERPDIFRLYRLYEFSREPRLFTLEPPLETQLHLEPLTFHASLR